ncbi:hypothetical protein D3C85_1430200 [compost metagenome]
MLMESTCPFSLSVSPSIACMSSNLFMYLRWSSRILQSELLMILSLTMGDWMMSSTSCVTTIASPKNFLTVLKRYFIYSAIPSLAIAFQASSISMSLRIPLSLLILLMNTSMMMMVTIGKRILWSLIASISNTMKRLESRSNCLSELSR